MQSQSHPRPTLPTNLRALVWGGAALLLCAPALAMLMSAEFDWGAGDFAIFGAMLALLCLAIEAAWRVGGNARGRALLALVALLAFFAVWIELAVGIFD